MYLVGLFTQLAYFGHYGMWVMFLPCIFQTCLMLYLVVLSWHFSMALRHQAGTKRGAAPAEMFDTDPDTASESTP